MIVFIPSSLLLFFLLWRMFADFSKWKHEDRLRWMRRGCWCPFRSYYARRVSIDSEKEMVNPPPNDAWMKQVWKRVITLAYLRYRIKQQ